MRICGEGNEQEDLVGRKCERNILKKMSGGDLELESVSAPSEAQDQLWLQENPRHCAQHTHTHTHTYMEE